MDKSEIRVFIVEDDQTLGKAIKELVKKSGYNAVLCVNPTEAENQFKIQGGHLLIVDCLLPKMSGVDFAKKLKDHSPDLPIILMSGIFKDKSFIKEALHKTGALAYLTKPFNISDLADLINKSLAPHIDEVSPLEQLLTSNHSPVERIGLINLLGEVEAFDIPWLCCLMMNGTASGVLSFANAKDKAAISFAQGKIVQVEMQNPESFFGALLIEQGFLSPSQLEEGLRQKSSKKLGERLIDMNMLSPHVIPIINAEQTANRLSRIITDTTYTVTFAESALQVSSSSIDTEGLAPFLVDWINSKISVDWLKQRYLKWMNSPTVKNSSTIAYQRLWATPPLKNSKDLINEFSNGSSLGQALAKGQYKEEVVYQVFHLLVLIGYMHLKREIKQMDEKAQIARLQRIAQDMAVKDAFGVLGINRHTKAADVKKTYYELAKIFHPDKLSDNASPSLRELTRQVFGKMTQAYETLADDKRREAYLKEIELGRAEKILQAENLSEEAKALLKSGQAKKAKEKFEEAMQMRPPNSELLIHLAWAKMVASGNMDEENMMSVEQTLNKIPPEDRHNAIYYFVKGLFQHLIGDENPAKKNIQHALALNPKFIEAERLLRTMEKSRGSDKTDIFRGDIGTFVGNLFKKK